MSSTITVGSPFRIKYVSDVKKLPTSEEYGTILVSSDGKVYKGSGADNPLLSLNDIISVNTELDLDAIVNKQQDKLYYTKDTNTIWTWDTVKFNKINSGVTPYDLTLNEVDIKVQSMTLFGKPVYAAVINTGTLPTDTEKSKTVPHNISNLEYLYKLEGFARDLVAANNNRLILNSMATSFIGNNAVALSADTSNIYITTSVDYSRFTESTVILYYTKTTDVTTE